MSFKQISNIHLFPFKPKCSVHFKMKLGLNAQKPAMSELRLKSFGRHNGLDLLDGSSAGALRAVGEQCVSWVAPASARPPVCAKALALLLFGGESRCELKLIHVLWSAALTLNCLTVSESFAQMYSSSLYVQRCLNAGCGLDGKS